MADFSTAVARAHDGGQLFAHGVRMSLGSQGPVFTQMRLRKRLLLMASRLTPIERAVAEEGDVMNETRKIAAILLSDAVD